MISQQEGNRK